MDGKIRKIITKYRMYHLRSDVDRIHPPRKTGGIGLIQFKQSFKSATIGLETHLNTSNVLLRNALKHGDSKPASVMKLCQKSKMSLDLHVNNEND